MVYYKLVKVTINVSGLVKVIIDMVVRHHSLLDSIISDCRLVFTLKFWSSLCYFLKIKQRLSIAFYPQINGQTERQNNIMEAYLRGYINFEQNNWAKFVLMAKFAHNNVKNVSTGHTPFKLNCGYHLWTSYEEDIDLRSQSKSAEKLANKLKRLMIVCKKNFQHT